MQNFTRFRLRLGCPLVSPFETPEGAQAVCGQGPYPALFVLRFHTKLAILRRLLCNLVAAATHFTALAPALFWNEILCAFAL